MSEAPHLTFDSDMPGVSRGHLVVPGGADRGELSLPSSVSIEERGRAFLSPAEIMAMNWRGRLSRDGLSSGCQKRKPVEGSSSYRCSIH